MIIYRVAYKIQKVKDMIVHESVIQDERTSCWSRSVPRVFHFCMCTTCPRVMVKTKYNIDNTEKV